MEKEDKQQSNEKTDPSELIVFTPPKTTKPPQQPPTPENNNTTTSVYMVDDEQRLDGFTLEDLANSGVTSVGVVGGGVTGGIARTAIIKVKKQNGGSPQLVQIIAVDRSQGTSVPVQVMSVQHNHNSNSDDKVDGERTDTQGSCDCGYKHWFQGKEVDFVIKPNGFNSLLGFNLGDNPYMIAEHFVMQNDLSKNLNHRNMINAVAMEIIQKTDRFYQTTETEKKEEKSTTTFDPTKSTLSVPTKNTTHWNPTTQQFEKTTYLSTDQYSKYTPEEVAENVKKLKILEAQRRQQEEEARKRDQDTAHITNLLRRDREETAADARLRNEKVAFSSETKTHGSVPVVIDGKIEWVEPNSRKVSESPGKFTESGPRTLKDLTHDHRHHNQHECQNPQHHHGPHEEGESDSSDDTEEDDDEDSNLEKYQGCPPKEAWTAEMVLNRLRKDVHPYDNTRQLLIKCGFSNSESVYIINQVLFHVSSERRKQKRQRTLDLSDQIDPRSHESITPPKSKSPENKVFKGHGFSLRSGSPETESTPTTVSSTFSAGSLLEVDPNSPKTSLKVRFADNTQVTIEVNHGHTVQQLTDHIRALSKVISFKLVNTGSFPPKPLTNTSQTIKEANLLNGTIQMSK